MSKPSVEGIDQNHLTPTTDQPQLTESTNKIEKPITNQISPAEYIYQSMIPPTTATTETVEVLNSLGKRDRCNTGGSTRSIGSHGTGPSPMMSMDLAFLSHDDVDLDGGLAGLNCSGDVSMRLQSSDFVKDLLTDAPPVMESSSSIHLPDTAATAAAALNAFDDNLEEVNDDDEVELVEPLPALPTNDEIPTLCQNKPAADERCPMMVNLTAKLQRISTGESIAPLDENFRISSQDWVKDFETDAAGMGAMHPSLFGGRSPPPVVTSSIPQNRESFHEYQVPIQQMPPLSSNPGHSQTRHPPMPPLSNPATVVHNMPTPSPVASLTKGASPTSSTTSKKRKKKRTIDTTRAIEPTDDDVLFGRGGYTNTHRGNIRFREKAMELRPWYESVSKEEKYNISQILIESVKGEGHRFLEKGPDKLWHEVVGNGARKKASQALRERVKGSRRKAGGKGGELSSSIKSVGSTGSSARGGGGNVNLEESIGNLLAADVDVVGI